MGAWAKALHYEWDSKVATGKRAVTPALALRVARFAGIPMDELLAGQWLSADVFLACRVGYETLEDGRYPGSKEFSDVRHKSFDYTP